MKEMLERQINRSPSRDVCGGTSPWKSNTEVTKVTLRLHRDGVDVARLTDEQVLKLARDSETHKILPGIPVNENEQ